MSERQTDQNGFTMFELFIVLASILILLILVIAFRS